MRATPPVEVNRELDVPPSCGSTRPRLTLPPGLAPGHQGRRGGVGEEEREAEPSRGTHGRHLLTAACFPPPGA